MLLTKGEPAKFLMTQTTASEDAAKTFTEGEEVDILVEEVAAVRAVEDEHTLVGTVHVKTPAAEAVEEGYVTPTGEDAVTAENFEAKVAAGLWSDEGTTKVNSAYTAVSKTEGDDPSLPANTDAETFAAAVETGLYTKSGNTYTKIAAAYVAPTYAEATGDEAPTEDTTDWSGFYVENNEGEKVQATGWDETATYFKVTDAGVPNGTKFSASETYYVSSFDESATYYVHQAAADAVEGVYEVTFTVPAYDFKIISIAKQEVVGA